MAQPVMQIGGRDGEKLGYFYGRLFGWRPVPAGPGYWLVPPEGGGIGGGLMSVEGDIPPHVLIYVAVDDLEATLERAAELGGRIAREPTPIPGIGSFALFEDPEGNLIGLMTTKY